MVLSSKNSTPDAKDDGDDEDDELDILEESDNRLGRGVSSPERE
jgi:hypothetical protein